MITTEPSSTASLDEVHGVLSFAIGGFWEHSAMQEFLDTLDATVMPLFKARRPVLVLGDFTDFVPQDRATGDAIRDHLIASQKYGLKRVAITGASPLMKMQYKRLSQGIEVQFFDDKGAARSWLRS